MPYESSFVCPQCANFWDDPLNGAEFTLSVAKNVAPFETARTLRELLPLSNGRGLKHRNKRSNFRLNRPFSHRKNDQIYTKTIGNRKKRLYVRLRSVDKHHLRKSSDRKHKAVVRSAHRTDLCFSIWRFSQVVFTSATSRTIPFFLFPIVLGVFALRPTRVRISSNEPVPSPKYENGNRTKTCDFTFTPALKELQTHSTPGPAQMFIKQRLHA